MKITFLGAGAAFTTQEYYQSNMLVTAASGKRLLIDCGTDIRHSLAEQGIHAGNIGAEIDAVYISHCHSDHIGGMEYFAFASYFGGKRGAIKLFAEQDLLRKLWNESLKGGLGHIQGKSMQMDEYFDCRPLSHNASFRWEEIDFQLVAMPHIVVDDEIIYSHGLLIGKTESEKYAAFISTDAQFRPDMISAIAQKVSVIFHDCETTPFKSVVHAHYDELRTLPAAVRNRMWLYHYQPDPVYEPEADGFKGFVKRGQEFYFD